MRLKTMMNDDGREAARGKGEKTSRRQLRSIHPAIIRELVWEGIAVALERLREGFFEKFRQTRLHL